MDRDDGGAGCLIHNADKEAGSWRKGTDRTGQHASTVYDGPSQEAQ
jgi:hypothetical protein